MYMNKNLLQNIDKSDLIIKILTIALGAYAAMSEFFNITKGINFMVMFYGVALIVVSFYYTWSYRRLNKQLNEKDQAISKQSDVVVRLMDIVPTVEINKTVTRAVACVRFTIVNAFAHPIELDAIKWKFDFNHHDELTEMLERGDSFPTIQTLTHDAKVLSVGEIEEVEFLIPLKLNYINYHIHTFHFIANIKVNGKTFNLANSFPKNIELKKPV